MNNEIRHLLRTKMNSVDEKEEQQQVKEFSINTEPVNYEYVFLSSKEEGVENRPIQRMKRG